MSPELGIIVDEAALLCPPGTADADAAAVQVAVFVEDALGITLDERCLDAAHLGTRERVADTLARAVAEVGAG
ncbi:hypothetical protein [Microbacterium luticocti]|uniref:hypothetical protein n=1 Tax=Microbacterium luticocti TaxID=451764 RepID=UPI00041E048E|nr:hypothetical protein [Microbacterium luticocti]